MSGGIFSPPGQSFTSVAAPLVNGGTPNRPNLSVSAASGAAAGSMSAADYTLLHNQAVITTINVPLTLAAGALDIQQASASLEGSLSAADYASLHPPTVRVNNSANIATVTGVLKLLTFDTEDYDLSAMHDPATNPGRLTVVRAGRHQFGCNIEWAASNVTERNVFIYKNGAKVAGPVGQAGSTGAAAQQAVWEGDCAVNDYFEVWVQQFTTVGINVNFVAGLSPAFWGHWMAKE